MKKAGKWLGRKAAQVVCTALIITLVWALLPYVQTLVAHFLGEGRYRRVTEQITHEMQKAGKLTVLEYTDTSVMTSTKTALLIGTTQTVKVPYRYTIGLGIDLEKVALTAQEDGVTVVVPDIEAQYDSFQVTGEVEVQDILGRQLAPDAYQKMQDEEAAACRAKYVEDQKGMEEAWYIACEELQKLFGQWTKQEVSFRFIRQQEAGVPEAGETGSPQNP